MNTVRIANALRNSGVDVSIAVSKSGGSYTVLLEPGIDVYPLTDGSPVSSVLRLLKSIIPLAKLARELKPDIICPVMLASGYVASLAAINLPKQIKLYLSVQNTLRPPQRPMLVRAIYSVLNNLLLRRFDRFIALSRGVAQDLTDLLPFTAGRTTIIHNAGVEHLQARKPEHPQPQTLRKSLACTTFIACGRLTRQKGYPYLLEAFAAVRRQCEARLIILGDGPLREQLVDLAERLGIQDDVLFAGFVPDPLAWLAKSDVFVLASLWEGFANVIVEAMSVGVPVIATDCPHGPAEIISDGIDGLLVQPADVADLTQAMMTTARDPALRERLGKRGFQRANDFTSERIAKSWLVLLRS